MWKQYCLNIDFVAEECVPDIFQREMPDFDKIPLPEYKPFRYSFYNCRGAGTA
jgi:hypothetical protein